MATRKNPSVTPAVTPAVKSPAATPASTPGKSAATKAARPPETAGVAKATKAPRSAKPTKPGKAPKVRRKPVRDSFTMPESDFSLIATLKARAMAAQRDTKKSELLRAGLHALAALDTPALVAMLGRLEPVKIGRPKQALSRD